MTLSKFKENNMDSILYHYTNAKGIIGIINSKSLWLTNMHFLNDSSEIKYSLKLFEEEIFKNKSIKNILNYRDTIMELIECGKDEIICSISFSEERDLLSQWRAYGDSGGGYSLGFSFPELMKLRNGYLDFVKCSYSKSEHCKMINEIMDDVKKECCQKNDNGYYYLNSMMFPIRFPPIRLYYYKPRMKDPAFKEEKEWRLINRNLFTSNLHYNFRNGNGIIPYYELNIENNLKSLIKSVTIGPCQDMKRSKRAIHDLLEHNKLSCRIMESTIPYRER